MIASDTATAVPVDVLPTTAMPAEPPGTPEPEAFGELGPLLVGLLVLWLLVAGAVAATV